ncbi:MAG: OadG family protein [Muribaculaceae bacterium]|nr:OadG family protein [Muribaculaceae bacterium]
MKKILLTAALFLTLTGAPAMAQPAEGTENGPSVAVENVQSPDSQTEIIADPTPSEEVNYIQESPVAKRMTQAEKAHNAEVNDSWGGAITIIAMCIVISALAILSLLFLGFGRISEKLLARNKRVAHSKPGSTEEKHEVDSGEVIAAISMALTEHFQGGHDYEDTILTIRRMKRAYSPWNSKIYNIRHEPSVKSNGFGI